MIENAKWITKLQDDRDKSIYFRKEFTAECDVESAKLCICALGLGVYTVNGSLVSDEVLCTPFTSYDKRVLYQTYDITKLVKNGKNAIGVHAGNGFYNDNITGWNCVYATWRDFEYGAKLAAAIEIVYKNGDKQTILTDTSWKVCDGACLYNHARQGEIYDASLVKEGFDKAGFNDSEWDSAHLTYAPGGVLEPMDMPPIRVIRTVKSISHSNGIYDFGENISGWVRVKAKGEKGREIRIRYDERLKDDKTLFGYINVFTKQKLKHEDILILSGNKTDEYAPSFCYHGFRYVQVENEPEEFEIIAEVVHTDLERVGSFWCSDDMLNKIHSASVSATLTNYHGIPTDCPHREQNGWTGDALISCEQALMNFNMDKAYRKWLNDFKDVQRKSGQIPAIVPTPNWGYSNYSGPAWDSALIQIPYFMYLNGSDKSVLENMWDSMAKYMNYTKNWAVDNLVDFGLGDWCPPEGAKECPVIVTSSAYYYKNAVIMRKIAKVLGKNFECWTELANDIRKAWRSKFLDDESLYDCQTFLACAIYQGMLETDEVAKFVDRLAELIEKNGGHIDCGILGTKYIFSALSENGRADIVYKMVTNPTAPSYAYWINNGMTTLCEMWNMEQSRNHHMFSEVDNWFYKHLAGIHISENGLLIKPSFVGAVEKVSAEHKGIKVNYDMKELNIESPCGFTLVLDGKEEFYERGKYKFDINRN